MAKVKGFHIAPFAMDGEPIQVGYWDENRFSMDTAGICAEMLHAEGPVFRRTLGGGLNHIELQLTSGNGAAIATLSARGIAALSALMLSGTSPAADQQVAEVFLTSVRTSSSELLDSPSDNAFEGIGGLSKKPVLAVVPWSNDAISDEDYSVVQEFCIHFAAAFFGAQ